MVPFLPRVHENRSHMVKIFFLIKFFAAQHAHLLPTSSRTTHGSSSTMLEQAATITKQPARGPNSPATTNSRNHHACNSPEPAHPLRRTTRTISSSQRRRSGFAIRARDLGPQVRSGPVTVQSHDLCCSDGGFLQRRRSRRWFL